MGPVSCGWTGGGRQGNEWLVFVHSLWCVCVNRCFFPQIYDFVICVRYSFLLPQQENCSYLQGINEFFILLIQLLTQFMLRGIVQPSHLVDHLIQPVNLRMYMMEFQFMEHTFTHLHVCVHVHMYTHTHTHTHSHTHTHGTLLPCTGFTPFIHVHNSQPHCEHVHVTYLLAIAQSVALGTHTSPQE